MPKLSRNNECVASSGHAGISARIALMVLMSITALIGIPAGVMARAAEEYKLGIQDKLQIKVGQWRPAEGVYENWEGFGGEYVVDPNGLVYLTLAGPVQAEGRTPPEVAEDISRLLQARLGLDQPPATSVEVREFRPVYVVGAVNNPGSFAYRPQMTVLQAVGLAGGHLRTSNPLLRTEREALSAIGEHESLRLRRWSAIARLARLRAELAGAGAIETPAELENVPVAADLLRLEQEILAARNSTDNSEKAALDGLKQLLTSQIDKFDKEIALRNQQIDLANEELTNITALKEPGTSTASRQAALSRDALRAIGEYEMLGLRRWSKIAGLARLRAELAGKEKIAVPQELAGVAVADDLIALEQEILKARLESVRSKSAAIVDLKQLMASQIEKLGEEIELRAGQVVIAKDELANVTSLKDRGLVVSSRQSQLSRTVAELEAKLLTLEVAKLTAEQHLNKAVRDELDIVNEHRQQIVTELQRVREELDQIESRLQTTRELYAAVGDLEIKVSGLEVAKLATEQKLSETERSALDTANGRRQKVVAELQKVRESLDQVEVKLRTTKDLYSETASRGIGLMNTRIRKEYSYQVTRQRDEQSERFIVDDQAMIKPGDTLQVISPELEFDASTSSFPELPD